MWRLYAEYGRHDTGLTAHGTGTTVAARAVGLLPALVLEVAIDAILLGTRPFDVPLVPDAYLPVTAPGQLWVAVGAGLSWLQNYGWNRFAQNIQHALRVDAYEALQ